LSREAWTDISVSISNPPETAGKLFTKRRGKGAVAGEDVGKVAAENRPVEKIEEAVARRVALTPRVRKHTPAGADHHVGPLGQERAYKLLCVGGSIGAVAIGHDVDVGVDVCEHAPDDMAFALPPFTHHVGAGEHRLQRRPVGGIVVVDVDARRRQSGAEAEHHVADRGCLIVAGEKDRDVDGTDGHDFHSLPGKSAQVRPARRLYYFLGRLRLGFRRENNTPEADARRRGRTSAASTA
jgi:hypothetical protein